MLFQFLFLQPRTQSRLRSHARTLPLLRYDNALTFEFQIRTLDGDHAYLQIHRKLADGRDSLALGPIADRNPLLDLLHDLEIDGPFVGLRDDEGAAHVSMLSIPSIDRASQAIFAPGVTSAIQ